jgi:hypothetical protein
MKNTGMSSDALCTFAAFEQESQQRVQQLHLKLPGCGARCAAGLLMHVLIQDMELAQGTAQGHAALLSAKFSKWPAVQQVALWHVIFPSRVFKKRSCKLERRAHSRS